MKNNKGITLIALVITIIVMLILIGVTISMAVNGGLFNYAGNAVRDTRNALNEEQLLTNTDMIEYYTSVKPAVTSLTAYSTALLNDDGVLEENAKYESGKYTAVIPKGFKIADIAEEQSMARGLARTATMAEPSIEDGLVIEDAEGNQFVWIPVKTGEFERTEWAGNEPTNKISEYYIENLSNDPTEEYENMLASVNKYGGFYIGRYEAGSKNNRYKTRTDETVLVQKGAYPYNFVMWGLEMDEYEEADDTYGHGAVYLSKEMYTDKDEYEYGVTSTLCYGVQWDAALRFVRDEKNVTTSTTWGNYNDNEFDFTGPYSSKYGNTWNYDETTKPENEKWLLKTGASEANKAKNIYDLAGNVDEWTMEAFSTNNRILRGGRCTGNGVRGGSPASDRRYWEPTLYVATSGFRPALYIK